MNADNVKCPKCGSNDWDWPQIGIEGVKQCTDCGEIYFEGKQTMTESEFETLFDKGDLDCSFADFICDRYDAINKEHMLRLWEDEGVFADFKDHMVASTMLQDAYFEGKHPLEAFPSIFGSTFGITK